MRFFSFRPAVASCVLLLLYKLINFVISHVAGTPLCVVYMRCERLFSSSRDCLWSALPPTPVPPPLCFFLPPELHLQISRAANTLQQESQGASHSSGGPADIDTLMDELEGKVCCMHTRLSPFCPPRQQIEYPIPCVLPKHKNQKPIHLTHTRTHTKKKQFFAPQARAHRLIYDIIVVSFQWRLKTNY